MPKCRRSACASATSWRLREQLAHLGRVLQVFRLCYLRWGGTHASPSLTQGPSLRKCRLVYPPALMRKPLKTNLYLHQTVDPFDCVEPSCTQVAAQSADGRRCGYSALPLVLDPFACAMTVRLLWRCL